jgi:DNA primase
VTDYNREALDEMCSKVNLLEYAENTMEFKRNGNDSFVTHCTLHEDKTPSLSICPSKNMFHCFSCGKGGNIINWLMTFENMSFNDAVDKVGNLTGIDVKHLKQCNSMKTFKEIKRITQNSKKISIQRKILNNDEIEKYKDEIPQEWVDEGINPQVMKKFNIRIDEKANRIVYPVYDNELNLIGIKGRTRYENYKLLGIPKYSNYYKIGTTDYFEGMKVTYEKISQTKKCFIFEGLKSVMKAYGWGYENSIAAETSCLNEEQVKLLIKLKIKEVTICFDSDVGIKKIKDCTDILRKFCNVYVVTDRRFIRDRLLGEKESPVDRGREVFETLLSERRKI